MSPGIDSKESNTPVYVAGGPVIGTTNLFLLGS
jgi:hypothetical protein